MNFPQTLNIWLQRTSIHHSCHGWVSIPCGSLLLYIQRTKSKVFEHICKWGCAVVLLCKTLLHVKAIPFLWFLYSGKARYWHRPIWQKPLLRHSTEEYDIICWLNPLLKYIQIKVPGDVSHLRSRYVTLLCSLKLLLYVCGMNQEHIWLEDNIP